MISTVLVPMDDSEMAEKALKFALEAHPNADITVFHVVGEPSPFLAEAAGLALADDIEEAAKERASDVFERAREIAQAHDVEIKTQFSLGQPAKAIVRQAENYDVVVMGSHGRDLQSRILMGNIAEKVSRRCPVPVTVVR